MTGQVSCPVILKSMRKISILLIVTVAVLLILAVFAMLPLHKVLVVTDIKKNQPVLYIKAQKDDYFIVSFTHSINKGQVYDYIRFNDNNLTIFKSVFDSFGAGMPETSVNGMVVSHNENGKVEVTGINNTLSSIRLAVGTVANHFLLFHDKKIMLADIVTPGDSVLFSIASVSYVDLWRGRFWHE